MINKKKQHQIEEKLGWLMAAAENSSHIKFSDKVIILKYLIEVAQDIGGIKALGVVRGYSDNISTRIRKGLCLNEFE